MLAKWVNCFATHAGRSVRWIKNIQVQIVNEREDEKVTRSSVALVTALHVNDGAGQGCDEDLVKVQ